VSESGEGTPTLELPLSTFFVKATLKALTDGLGLRTVEDLLQHYPRRYAERGALTDLASLRVGELVTVMAEVKSARVRPMRQRAGRILEVVVTDGHGSLTLTFFNQAWRERELQVGRSGLFAGKVGEYRGVRQLANPDYELIDEVPTPSVVDDLAVADDAVTVDRALDAVAGFASALIPVYPATAALPSWKVAACVRQVLDVLGEVPDPVPEVVRAGEGLMDLGRAYRLVHRPESRADWQAAQARLRFDEAFVLQVVLARRRVALDALRARPRPTSPDGLLAAFDARLPFELTAGQVEVGETLARDLASERPMNRLLQGEVGSGKTVVALRAMLAVVDAGGQAVLLAPTEVLAQQHHRSITELLGPMAERGMLGGEEHATQVALVTGSQTAAVRRKALLDVASGDAGIVVGTHALLEDTVQLVDLGLVVVDEQHRFGVEQRDALRFKAGASGAGGGEVVPHMLVMTATPIPRTVAMTVFGDLEVSTLTELPRGRAPIQTFVVPSAEAPHYLARTWERVREEVAAGRQAFVVCPRIGGEGPEPDLDLADAPRDEADAADGDATPVARRPPVAVVDVAAELADGPLAGLRIDVLHGRLTPDIKEGVMRRFVAGEIDVLVATTVVEVGVDVPNASAMVVLDADRFGVSQLHQLRGRVGRGSAPSICLLVTDAPPETQARERLDAVAATTDGFELSRVDLAQRREGNVLGAAQSGSRSSLKLLSVLDDEDVIVRAREAARTVVEGDPDLTAHVELARELDRLLRDDRADYLEKS
jgi:ATP-dependent DNA helicase RecG